MKIGGVLRLSRSEQDRMDGNSRWPHIYLAAGCALIISLLVASYMQASLGLSALSSLERLNTQTDHLDQLMMLVTDAETGVRGFQLTDDPAYLDPYLSAVPRIAEGIQLIRKDYAPGLKELREVDEISRLVDAKLAILGEAIKLRDVNNRVDKSQLERGKATMDELRTHVRRMKSGLSTEGQISITQSIAGFKKTRVATILLAVGALVLLVVLFALAQRQQQLRDRLTRLLRDENDMLDREVKSRTEDLVKLASYLTNVLEAEKLRLARELHDELGALLTAAKLDAGWIERKLPPELMPLMGERLVRLQDTLGSGIALKRRITNDLRPALLYDLGLVSSLRVLGEEFARADEVEIDMSLPDQDVHLPDDLSLALFRIVQESLTNIRKYANANRVQVGLSMDGEGIHLRVTDNGVGFDTHSPTLARHGLAGMRHRAFMFSGSIEIVSTPGAGTRIEVDIPVPGDKPAQSGKD